TESQLATTSGVGTPSRTFVSSNSFVSGDSNYLGTEANLGMTWRFSANTAFDLVGGYFFAGDAFDAAECTNNAATCTPNLVRKKSAPDAYTLAARVLFEFLSSSSAVSAGHGRRYRPCPVSFHRARELALTR